MKLQFLKLMVLFCVCGQANAKSSNPDINLQFLTEQAPPYNYMENGQMKGLAVEILDALLVEMHSKTTSKNVQILPFARAFRNTQEPGKMNVLFAVARTPEREALFNWVGPILDAKFVIWASKNSTLHIADLESLKKYTYVVVRDDAADHLLVASGVPDEKIFRVSSFDSMPKMVEQGRADFFAYDEIGAKYHFHELNIGPDHFKSIFTLSKSLQYFAFSKAIPDKIVKQYQMALERIAKQIANIKSKY